LINKYDDPFYKLGYEIKELYWQIYKNMIEYYHNKKRR
jgi:hypothetical protein